MAIDHKNLYDSEHVSRDYGKRDYLEPAEETFITELGRVRLAAMDMLDMGVGGGRTTKYFAPIGQKLYWRRLCTGDVESLQKKIWRRF